MASVATLCVLAACATAPPRVVPDTLKIPSGQMLAQVFEADGVQIYQCEPTSGPPDGYAWVFRAPEARLTDRAGKIVGHHYAGPTWEANDGSKVMGEVVARDPGTDAAAIPWLLLRATSTSGSGPLSKTVSILRLNTVGGKAPSSGCGADSAGQMVRVPYQAQYRFFVARP